MGTGMSSIWAKGNVAYNDAIKRSLKKHHPLFFWKDQVRASLAFTRRWSSSSQLWLKLLELRMEMCNAAVRLGSRLNYKSAGS